MWGILQAVVYVTDQEADLEKVDQMSLRMMSMMAQGVELAGEKLSS